MNPQALKRLSTALVILVVVWLGVKLLRGAQADTVGRMPVSHIDPKTIDAVTLVKNNDTLHFVRGASGKDWTVNGKAANTTFVDLMVGAVGDTSAISELVAENASSHASLGLDTVSAVRLTARSGSASKPAADLLLGHRGSSYGTIYARLPGQDKAYSVKSGLADVVDRPLDEWRDKAIAHVAVDSVARVDVTRGKKFYSLTKGEKGWLLDGKDADSSAVANLLNQFQQLNGTGFAADSQLKTIDFSKPDRVLRVFDKQGKSLVSLLADSMASGFWVRREGDSSTVFRMDSYGLNQLTPSDSTLRKK